MSVSEVDISAALDELLRDEEVFKELRELPLQDISSTTAGLPCTAEELDSFDLSFLFSDFPDEATEGVWSTQSHALNAHSESSSDSSVWSSEQDHISLVDPQQQTDAIVFDSSYQSVNVFTSSDTCSVDEVLELCKGVATPTSVSHHPNPTSTGDLQADSCTAEHGNESATVATLQACVQHDHSYAMTGASPESVTQVEGERMEVEGGSDSGSTEEGSTYDAGVCNHPTLTSQPTPFLCRVRDNVLLVYLSCQQEQQRPPSQLPPTLFLLALSPA